MGEANLHMLAAQLLHACLFTFLKKHRPKCQAFSNLNLYYQDGPPHPRTGASPNVAPDVMVVQPYQHLPEEISSYTIGKDGPAPLLTIEVMSPEPGIHRDFVEKSILYRSLGIAEYVLYDATSKYEQSLLLRRLGEDGDYHDHIDEDGGVTSELGFRIVMQDDGLAVLNLFTGHSIARPLDAERHAEGRRRARKRQRAAEKKALFEQAARKKIEQELKALQDRLRQLEEERKESDQDA